MKIKIDNFEIYKLKQAGLSNQQVLKVLQYGEIYDQELSLETIAEASECRNPIVFMERQDLRQELLLLIQYLGLY